MRFGARLIAALFLLLSGCSFFSRAKNDVYTIDVVPGTASKAGGTPIGIGALELPPGIDRREIVVRKAGQQLDVRGNELWPATFSQLVLHTLAFDLAARLPAGMMVLPGESKPAAMRSIDIAFQEIAAGPEPKVTIDAQWESHREHIEVPITSLDSANVAEGISKGLGELADRIAAAF